MRSLLKVCALSSLILLSLSLMAKEEKADKKEKKVFSSILKKQDIFDLLAYPAIVESTVNAQILSEGEGVVEKINIVLGQKVKKGQVLMTIRNNDPVYSYKAISIKSPVNGIVSSLDTTQGSLVNRGNPLAKIVDPTQLKLTFHSPATDLHLLKVSDTATFEVETGQIYKTKIVGISPVLDRTTGTATVEMRLVDDKLPRVGVLGRLKFKAGIHKGIQIPESNIYYIGKGPVVYKISKDFVVSAQKIKLGKIRQGLVEVLEGIKELDHIVTNSSEFIKEGDKVSVNKK